MKKFVHLLLWVLFSSGTIAVAQRPYDHLKSQLVQRYSSISEVDQFIGLVNKHWKLIRKWHIKMRRSLWPPMSDSDRQALGLIEDASKPEHLSLHHPFVEDWFICHLGLLPRKQGPHFGKLVTLLDTRKTVEIPQQNRQYKSQIHQQNCTQLKEKNKEIYERLHH